MNNQNLVVKVFDGSKIFFLEDGYINATKSAKIFDKVPKDWLRLDQTKEYIEELLKQLNEKMKAGNTDLEQKTYTYKDLVIVKQGGNNGGTWIHSSLKDVFERWCKSRTSNKIPELYVVLFSTNVIKIGKSSNGFSRVKSHISQAQCFGVKTLQFFIEKNPTITEENLIQFCNQHGTLHHGNEYFTDLNYDLVVNFVRRKIERKPLRLVRSNN